MTQVSAGLVVLRRRNDVLEILLGHPGGPFWRARDDGAWTIPKGLIADAEDPLAAARREFAEETGLVVDGPFVGLPPLRQPSGKIILAFAVEADLDLAAFVSNTFSLEWPKGSGRKVEHPEIDRIAYFVLEEALRKALPGQRPILEAAAAVAERGFR